MNKKYSKCFQYAATVTLNQEEIKTNSQRKTKSKPYKNKFNWEGINYPSEKDDWKKFERNSLTITLNVLHNKKEKHMKNKLWF